MLNKIYNEDCLIGMKKLEDSSIDLIVTSPPYFNAREYSTWETFELYMENMTEIFTESFRILKNYRQIVVNVGDIVGKTNGKNSSSQKIALGAKFTVMLEDIGFRFIDDIIWDKGEVQSKRNFSGGNYPFQKYPINSYEHILIFKKIVNDNEKPFCPICSENKVVINGVVNGVQTYECKNKDCSQKSPKGRGYRFSNKKILVDSYEKEENLIDEETIKFWRRDIVKLPPVIKINNKKENTINHSAPYPVKIPEMAIKFFSGKNDLVLDPFMGSGTTAIACMNTNRNFIGFELDETYYKLGLDRIKNHK